MSDPITEGLAANVLRLGNEVRDLSISNAVLRQDNERLKAEVERLTSEVSYDNRVQLHVDKLAAEFTQSEVERLQAEVEALRKELADAQENYHLVNEMVARLRKDSEYERMYREVIEALKEGNQP